MEKLVTARKNELKRLIKKYEAQAEHLPKGRVFIKKKERTNALILRNGGKKEGAPLKIRYIPLKDEDAPALATKLYLDRLIPVLHKEEEALERYERDYQPDEKYGIFSALPRDVAGKIRDPLLSWEEKSAKWEKSLYERNPVEFDSAAKYYTMKGERVRSRAEIIIGDMLLSLKIPYRYECVYKANGRKYYPDFTIMNPIDGEKYYIEYFGLMNVESYRKRALAKIRIYNKTKDADRFIYIFEDEGLPLDTVEIKNLILRKFERSN